MRKEYDLGAGRRNPYAKRIAAAGRSAILERFLEAEHYVRLDADVAEAFGDSAAVNEALRLVLRARCQRERHLGPDDGVRRSRRSRSCS